MDIDYSFIIPHKNTPELLEKCLASIPRRADVQIIVVDDDSDPNKVDFENFPGADDPTVEVYLTKKGRGAGYARNVGLEHARGKWLVFADADDFFLSDIEKAMVDYENSDADVVFFKGTAIKIPSGCISGRGGYANEAVEEALKTGDFTMLSLLSYPCKKFFRRSFIETNHIRFNECRWGNDVMFCSRIAVATDKFVASNYSIYCITESESSLIKDRSLASRIVRFEQESESVTLVRKKYPKIDQIYRWYFDTWFNVYKCSKRKALRLLPKAITVAGLRFLSLCYKAKFC